MQIQHLPYASLVISKWEGTFHQGTLVFQNRGTYIREEGSRGGDAVLHVDLKVKH